MIAQSIIALLWMSMVASLIEDPASHGIVGEIWSMNTMPQKLW